MDSYTKVLLTFQESTTKDECGNTWVAYNHQSWNPPTISADNAKFGSALQLTHDTYYVSYANYIQMANGIELGQADFTIDLWIYMSPKSDYWQTDSIIYVLDPYIDQEANVFTKYLDSFLIDGLLHHIAIIYIYQYNVLLLFVDGVLQEYDTFNYMEWDRRFVRRFQIGPFYGAMSEFRISDGVARFITDDNGALIDPTAITVDDYQDYQEVVVNKIDQKWFDPPTQPYTLGNGTEEKATFDTLRRLGAHPFEQAIANTLRHITVGRESAQADSLRRLTEGAIVNTTRLLSRKETAYAHTVRRHQIGLRYVTSGTSLVNTFKDYGITEFNISLQEMTLSDRFTLTTTHSDFDIFSAINGQLFNYDFTFFVEKVNETHGLKTLQGLRDRNELFYTLVYSAAHVDKDGNEYATGSAIQYLNKLPLAKNSHSLPAHKIGDQYVIYATASYFVLETAKYLGLLCDINIDDFGYSGKLTDVNLTYRDMITQLFSWTKKVPRRQINAFVRGNTLYVIQRGKEDSAYDITSLPHSEPVFERSLVRTMYNRPGGSYYSEVVDDDDLKVPFTGYISFSDDRFDHVLYYSRGFLRSENHTSKNTLNANNDTNYTSSNTTYEYQSRKTNSSISGAQITSGIMGSNENITQGDYDYYLSKKQSINISMDSIDRATEKQRQELTTTYRYSSTEGDGYYLANEYEVSKEQNFVKSPDTHSWTSAGSETTIRITLHVPLGNGWYGTTVKVNGKNEGSSISQGNADNKVSPYTVDATQTFAKIIRSYSVDNVDTDSKLVPIESVSFPVSNIKYVENPKSASDLVINELISRKILIAELRWMNMKICEKVSVTLWTPIVAGVPLYNHIVDFTERILLDDHEYFLVSNQINFTPRQLSQQLELVRWF